MPRIEKISSSFTSSPDDISERFDLALEPAVHNENTKTFISRVLVLAKWLMMGIGSGYGKQHSERLKPTDMDSYADIESI